MTSAKRITHPWLFTIRQAEIRDAVEKPTGLPADVSAAWDLTAAGFVCRLGRMVIPEYYPAMGPVKDLNDTLVPRFLSDRAVKNVLKIWEEPVYLGPAAIPCYDGSAEYDNTFSVTTSHDGFRSLGLWVPEGRWIDDEWTLDTDVKIDPSRIPFEPIGE